MLSSDVLQQIKDYPTPFYLYDLSLLRDTLTLLDKEAIQNNYKVHYAVKANNNDPILNLIREAGFGADCVSGPEVEKALACGFTPENILLAGVGKTDEEIITALKNNISALNCESIEELAVIAGLAGKMDLQARISLRINPNVDAHTHNYITTGLAANKFGIGENELSLALEIIQNNPSLHLCGMHVHIGSQINDPDVFKSLCLKINELKSWFTSKQIRLEHINVGGGLGVNYENPDADPIADFKTYFSTFHKHLKLNTGESLQVELGRSIVAQCGSLVTRVLYTKKSAETDFLVVDAGMTELLRPALYQAFHLIQPLEPIKADIPQRYYDIVGPVCETSDCFGRNIPLPNTKRGDHLIIRSTGAYGEVMASNYNLRKNAKRVYIDGPSVFTE